MKMEEQLISYDTAKLAKEKGLERSGIAYYSPNGILWQNGRKHPNQYQAITQSLLQKYLREKHKLRVFVDQSIQGIFRWGIYKWNYDNNIGKWQRIAQPLSYNTYEEALEVGLKEGLKLIKL
jgi:hypothetical protein